MKLYCVAIITYYFYSRIWIFAICFRAVVILMLSLTRTLLGQVSTFASCCQKEHFSARSSVCGEDYQITEWNDLMITVMPFGHKKKEPQLPMGMVGWWHESTICITGPLCRNSPVIPLTKAGKAELCCFICFSLNRQLSCQWVQTDPVAGDPHKGQVM